MMRKTGVNKAQNRAVRPKSSQNMVTGRISLTCGRFLATSPTPWFNRQNGQRFEINTILASTSRPARTLFPWVARMKQPQAFAQYIGLYFRERRSVLVVEVAFRADGCSPFRNANSQEELVRKPVVPRGFLLAVSRLSLKFQRHFSGQVFATCTVFGKLAATRLILCTFVSDFSNAGRIPKD